MSRKRFYWPAVAALTVFFTVVLGMPAMATTITTDLFVYQNGDTVTVTGESFGLTEVVDVVTTAPSGTVVDHGTPTTDEAGAFTYQFVLNATESGLYDVVGTGETSGLTASTQFDPAPHAVLAPTTKDFGSIGVGSSSSSQTFTITNDGIGQLTVSSVTSSDSTQFPVTVSGLPTTVNSGSSQSKTFTVLFSPTSSGSQTATITVFTNGTNPTASVSGTGVLADTTAPETSITSNPNSPTNSTSASFGFTGTDPDDATAALTYECRLDSGSFTSCTSPQNLSGLAQGSHTFQVRAKDAANNVDPTPASYTWVVDTAAPTITFVSQLPNVGGGWNNSSVTVTWSCSDSGSGVVDGTVSETVLTEGANLSATGTCTDHAGNTASNTRTGINIDKTPPTVSATPSRSADSGGWYNHPFDVTFTASDNGPSGSGSCDSPVTYSGPEGTGLSVSGHCTDGAGNQGTGAFGPFKYDAAAPAAPDAPDLVASSDSGVSDTDNITNDATPTFYVGGLESGATMTLYAGTTVLGTETVPAGQSSVSFTVPDALDDGLYTISATQTDAAGNVSGSSPSLAPSLKIDTVNPISLASSPTYNNDGTIDVTYTASDIGGSGPKSVDLYVKVPGGSYTLAMSDVDGVGTGIDNAFAYAVPSSEGVFAQGTYRFYTIATDVAGNAEAAPAEPDATTTQTLQDSIAPAIDVSHTADGSNGWNKTSTVAVTVTASDAGSGLDGAPACTVDAEAATLSGTGPWTLSVSGNGTHEVYCWVADNATNSNNDSDTVKIDTTPPVITPSTVGTLGNNGWYVSNVTVSWTVSDPESGIASSSGCGSTTIGSDTTGWTLTCSAANGAGLSSSVSVTIKRDATAPTITASVSPFPAVSGWYNIATGPPTVTFTCTDTISHIASCTGPTTLGQGWSLSATGTAVDNAGNSNTATASGLYVDLTAPTITFAGQDPEANSNGWNNTDVTLTWNCLDSLSGVEYWTDTKELTGEGANQQATGTCEDHAGNTASATQGGINIDKTAPSASASASPGPNANGWNNTDVTVSFTGDPGTGSAIDTCSANVVLSSEGTNLSASGTCTDLAGNESDPATKDGINIDKTKPVITGSRTPAANSYGWNNTDVSVSFSCAEVGTVQSSIASNTAAGRTVTAEGADQSVTNTGSCTDKAGNMANQVTVAGISIDKTAPSLSGAPTTSPNGAGWYKSDVTIHWTESDTLSDIDPTTIPADSTISAEGTGLTATASVSDKAGNSTTATSSPAVSIDKTAPTLTWNGGPADGALYYFGFVPAAPTCDAHDALSGPNGCSVDGYGGALGPHTMTATAYDVAGNSKTETRTYTVLAWTLKGFYPPVDMNGVFNVTKGGSTVPLKFNIFAGTTELTDTAYVSSLKYSSVACDATSPQDTIETLATGGTVLRYDGTGGQFIYNWKTPVGAGKCYSVVMRTADGSSLSAFFKMK